ncbi:hypothetical protein BKA57DRAFT_454348 [Linnemannia elongata]|nr:hypothetical protein BKA57DRAFT_454348 [Linnemannia elongata]
MSSFLCCSLSLGLLSRRLMIHLRLILRILLLKPLNLQLGPCLKIDILVTVRDVLGRQQVGHGIRTVNIRALRRTISLHPIEVEEGNANTTTFGRCWA